MKGLLFSAVATGALVLGAPSMAQDITNTSGSNSNATSGSVSGSQSEVANAANNNIGTSNSASNSNSDAVSGSNSQANSNGNMQGQGQDQGQSQGQSANNAQGQDQGQSQGQNANNSQGQGQDQGQSQGQNANNTQMQGQETSQGNAQSTSITFNSTQRKTTEVRTNAAVPLAASSSFSSDYCGGTVSGGASASPIGISIGGAAPKFDKTCQYLRRAEKFGMAAANAHNMNQPELAGRLMSMMVWSICNSDTDGRGMSSTASACSIVGLSGPSTLSANTPSPPPPDRSPEPQVAVNGEVTPEAAARAITLPGDSNSNARATVALAGH